MFPTEPPPILFNKVILKLWYFLDHLCLGRIARMADSGQLNASPNRTKADGLSRKSLLDFFSEGDRQRISERISVVALNADWIPLSNIFPPCQGGAVLHMRGAFWWAYESSKTWILPTPGAVLRGSEALPSVGDTADAWTAMLKVLHVKSNMVVES